MPSEGAPASAGAQETRVEANAAPTVADSSATSNSVASPSSTAGTGGEGGGTSSAQQTSPSASQKTPPVQEQPPSNVAPAAVATQSAVAPVPAPAPPQTVLPTSKPAGADLLAASSSASSSVGVQAPPPAAVAEQPPIAKVPAAPPSPPSSPTSKPSVAQAPGEQGEGRKDGVSSSGATSNTVPAASAQAPSVAASAASTATSTSGDSVKPSSSSSEPSAKASAVDSAKAPSSAPKPAAGASSSAGESANKAPISIITNTSTTSTAKGAGVASSASTSRQKAGVESLANASVPATATGSSETSLGQTQRPPAPSAKSAPTSDAESGGKPQGSLDVDKAPIAASSPSTELPKTKVPFPPSAEENEDDSAAISALLGGRGKSELKPLATDGFLGKSKADASDVSSKVTSTSMPPIGSLDGGAASEWGKTALGPLWGDSSTNSKSSVPALDLDKTKGKAPIVDEAKKKPEASVNNSGDEKDKSAVVPAKQKDPSKNQVAQTGVALNPIVKQQSQYGDSEATLSGSVWMQALFVLLQVIIVYHVCRLLCCPGGAKNETVSYFSTSAGLPTGLGPQPRKVDTVEKTVSKTTKIGAGMLSKSSSLVRGNPKVDPGEQKSILAKPPNMQTMGNKKTTKNDEDTEKMLQPDFGGGGFAEFSYEDDGTMADAWARVTGKDAVDSDDGGWGAFDDDDDLALDAPTTNTAAAAGGSAGK
ncbi:unnamed protein product [Amoebophrya sp. A25]|nr:unnamed protein product [Amoebophrya sp. A25]|eukprot:GSA25T00007786001.1